MPWDTTRPTGTGTRTKYRTPEHIAYTKQLKAQLAHDGYLICTAKVCHLETRTITNPNGNQPDGLTAGHADNGVDYDGPQHRLCNTRDGARRGNQRSHGQADTPRRWEL